MKSDPLIQVLVCTYQGERFVREQLDSIIKQHYPAIEIYIFDDGSTDKTVTIIHEYCERYSNIFLYENDNNLGFLRNFEQAIANSSANYIALSDQDDIWELDKLSLSMEALIALEYQNPKCPALVHSDLSYIDEVGKKIHSSYFKKKGIDLSRHKALSQILGHCGIMGNTILMNRLLAEKALPFPCGLKYHDYWLAVINELFGVRKTLTVPLVQYRIHRDNSSENNRIIQKSKKKVNGAKKWDFPLPFMDDLREIALKTLLKTYSISADDSYVIKGYCNYLVFNSNRLSHYFFLLKNGFLKQGLVFKLTTLYRLILTTRYKKTL